MMDAWTKKAPDGTTITFKKEGSRETGFVYTAEGRMLKETSAIQKELTRAETEAYFNDYVNGAKPVSDLVKTYFLNRPTFPTCPGARGPEGKPAGAPR